MKLRYPAAPSDFTPEQKDAWNSLIRQLDRERQAELFGNPNTIPVNQLKDGVFMKSFTTITASISVYYAVPSDGTILIDNPTSTVNIYLTSAVDSRYAMVCVKKVGGSPPTNSVIIQDISGASIDTGFTTTVSVTNGSIMLGCDGHQWYIMAEHAT